VIRVMAVTTPTPWISVRVHPSSASSAGTCLWRSLICPSIADVAVWMTARRASLIRSAQVVSGMTGARAASLLKAERIRLVAGSCSRTDSGSDTRTRSASVSSRKSLQHQ